MNQTSGPPYRAPRRHLRPVAVLSDRSLLKAIVFDIVRRIRDLDKNMGGGAYLIIEKETVYLISENASGAADMFERFSASILGLYTRTATDDFVLEDIECYLNGVS